MKKIVSMILHRKGILGLFVFPFLAICSCNRQEEPATMQPTEGYPFTTNINEIEEILEFRGLDTIAFQHGEIIADIGAGNGYIEALLSIFHDSLTFYIQDIDSSVCNERALKEVIDYYQAVKGTEFQNEFRIVIGTDTETNLPDDTFDRIFMLWTYQYLKEPDVFIQDIREDLKAEGLFYVINPQIEEDEYSKSLRTRYGWNVSPLERQISDIIDNGFELLRISKNYNTKDYNQPYIMVFKRK
jgi:SAM-dependent methyltransferase